MVGLPQPSVSYSARHASWRRVVGSRRLAPRWFVELALLDIAVALNGIWLMRAVIAVLLATVPGELLLKLLRVPAKSVRRYLAYLPCASIAVLFVVTLGVDTIGPLLGDHEPLRLVPLLLALNVALPVLALVAGRAPASCDLEFSDLIGRARWLWPLVLPVLSVVAAARLDNGDGNTLAVLILAAVAVMVPVVTFLAERLRRRQVNILLYSSGLALMLLTSMRSAYVIGFDINSEYYDMHQTVLQGVWHFGHLNPYEAMLSLTVLPASLHALIGGQDVWIFKFGYPALFALFPVAVYSLGRRFLSRRASFVAAALVLVQSYFFEQQPEIARQEIGLLLFAGIVGVLFDSSLERRSQLSFVAILGVALALSHYSTTYIAIVLCLLAVAVALTIARRKAAPIRVLPWLVAAGSMTVTAAVWYGPATHSTSDITAAAQAFRETGLQLLPGRTKGESIISAYFNGVRESPPSAIYYQNSTTAYYARSLSFITPLPQASAAVYDAKAATPLSDPDRAPMLAKAQSDAALLVQQAIDALAVLSALVFTLRRRGDPLTRMIGAIGLGSFFVLAASRLSGALASDYNPSRLFLQCLFFLSLLEAALFEMVAQKFRLRTWVTPAIFGAFSLMLLVSFIGYSGLSVPLLGGTPPLMFSNSGEDYVSLYQTPQEKATAQWLAEAVPKRRVIYADYFGQLRLFQFTDLRQAVFVDILPQTIDQHAWVFATRANIVDHRTWGPTNAGLVDLVYPITFLDRYFDVVYSTGTTAVFHR